MVLLFFVGSISKKERLHQGDAASSDIKRK
jgi:hypothetical protein